MFISHILTLIGHERKAHFLYAISKGVMCVGQDSTFNKKIVELKKIRGVSNYDLSIAINTTESYISKILSGNKVPSIQVIIALVNYFGVGLNDCLYPETEEKATQISTIESQLQQVTDKTDLEFLRDALINLKVTG